MRVIFVDDEIDRLSRLMEDASDSAIYYYGQLIQYLQGAGTTKHIRTDYKREQLNDELEEEIEERQKIEEANKRGDIDAERADFGIDACDAQEDYIINEILKFDSYDVLMKDVQNTIKDLEWQVEIFKKIDNNFTRDRIKVLNEQISNLSRIIHNKDVLNITESLEDMEWEKKMIESTGFDGLKSQEERNKKRHTELTHKINILRGRESEKYLLEHSKPVSEELLNIAGGLAKGVKS